MKPREVTAAVMFPKWTYQPGEEDLTVMRISVEGRNADGHRARVTWNLVDFYDRASHATSMSRTTALPCTIIARLILAGKVSERGVLPPELLGRRGDILNPVCAALGDHSIRYTRSQQELPA